ncbi:MULTISPECIES: ROK family protein [Staphylococcus]|uniref:N-acetylmannosamine kinase n=1 Tax=Staphylococcus agnetis TaxID=985762 RepID=A0A2T4MHY8_9STAP|nr:MULTISPECIES: ROK family protein [Staphylococcus]ALN77127.1 ROK family protein [Staphylococcus agnetis]MDG4943310.1 ROK family protein [Staphylococcus agnetis]NHM91862.1 ROK family protein [Staphylococcus sp. 10602379]NJI02590.1 ROK family protein [Staphylococcus agnetis]NJI12423.1 ROK family protein [Staphylococcus agnetis]
MTKIAFDIGGTFLKSAIVDSEFNLKGYQKLPTPVNENDAILNEILRRVKTYMHTFHLKEVRIGISTAGAVNQAEGTIVYANDNILNYSGTHFKQALRRCASHVNVYNDVDAALLGELSYRKQSLASVFCLTLGTGIGGSYFQEPNGLMVGARHRANEIGNLLYDFETKTNYEDRASTRALKKLMVVQNYGHDNVIQLFEDAHHYEASQKLLHTWGREVARGIAEVQIMYDPAHIIIGGGISKQQRDLLKYIEPHVQSFLPPHYGHAKIETAQLHNDAALIGAVSKL